MKRGKMKAAVVWILVLMMMATCMGVAALASEEIQGTTENPVSNVEVKPEKEIGGDQLPEQEEKQSVTESNPESTPEPAATVEADQEEPTTDSVINESQESDPQSEPEAEPEVPASEDEEEPSGDEPESEELPAEYTVKFLNADDNEFLKVTVGEGELIPEPKTDPSLVGFEFRYWYNVKEGEKTPFKFTSSAVATEDLILKAYFEQKDDAEIEEPLEDDENGIVKDETIEEEPGEGELELEEELLDGEEELPEEELIEEELIEEDPRSDLSDAHIKIWMDINEETQMGDTVTVSCAIANIYGWEFSAQWQRKDAGGEWTDIPGANGANYSFTLTEDTLETEWRVRIDVIVPEGVEVDPV